MNQVDKELMQEKGILTENEKADEYEIQKAAMKEAVFFLAAMLEKNLDMSELQTISLYLKELSMEEDIMKKMKESNGENFCRASGCGYARCFTGISPKYMAKMNKEDRNNFQTAIEEILEDLNLGGHVTAEPLMSERTKEYFDSYKDEAYYSLSPKKRKIVDMQQRGYIDEDGQIDEDAIYDDACEAAETWMDTKQRKPFEP